MRCQCCNRSLSDYESCLRHPTTLEYLDICCKCLEDIPIEPIEPATKVDDVGYEDDPVDINDVIMIEEQFFPDNTYERE